MYNELVDAVSTDCCSLARYVLLFGHSHKFYEELFIFIGDFQFLKINMNF